MIASLRDDIAKSYYRIKPYVNKIRGDHCIIIEYMVVLLVIFELK